jgi:hypothetical protein
MYAFDGFVLATTHTATPLPGWPVSLPSLAASGVPAVATGVISSPALFPSSAGNGTLQTATGVFLAGSDASHPAFTINSNGSQGTILHTNAPGAGSNFTDSPFLWAVAQTAIGQLGSATRAVVTGGLSTQIATDTAGPPGKKPGFQHAVGAYDPASGAALATFPRQIEDWQFLSGPAIADVKGDGTHQVIEGSGGGFVHAFDPAAAPAGAQNNLSTSLSRYADGAEPSGFPVFTGGYITSTPTVGQLARADRVAVATVTRDGYLFLTETNGDASANDQWWHFHHDERNTGLYGLDTRPPGTVDDLSAQAGASPGTATVSWTEVGDDWWVGQVPNGNVDLRWSTAPITDANFSAANQVTPPATTAASGSPEQVNVSGLPTNGQTIYFAERATDDSGNTSLIAHAKLIKGYPRPRGARPLRASLSVAYKPCSAPNRTHGAPLAYGSCNPPQQASSQLTVGTPDANGNGASSVGSVTYRVDTSDVLFEVALTDVRNKTSLSDYTGQLQLDQTLRLTDRKNGPDQDEPATVVDTSFPVTVPCAATASTIVGSTCSISASANALVPGAVTAGERAVWELGQIKLFDGGADGLAATQPNTLFADQALFVP